MDSCFILPVALYFCLLNKIRPFLCASFSLQKEKVQSYNVKSIFILSIISAT